MLSPVARAEVVVVDECEPLHSLSDSKGRATGSGAGGSGIPATEGTGAAAHRRPHRVPTVAHAGRCAVRGRPHVVTGVFRPRQATVSFRCASRAAPRPHGRGRHFLVHDRASHTQILIADRPRRTGSHGRRHRRYTRRIVPAATSASRASSSRPSNRGTRQHEGFSHSRGSASAVPAEHCRRRCQPTNRTRRPRPRRGLRVHRPATGGGRCRKGESPEPLAKTGDRPGFLCRKPQARDGQWAGRSV